MSTTRAAIKSAGIPALTLAVLLAGCGPASHADTASTTNSPALLELSPETGRVTPTVGTVFSYTDFPSVHVDPRQIDVWLPEGFDASSQERYAVLYMHDGQNLFDTAWGYGNQSWHVDTALQALIDSGSVRKTILVGVWNTQWRFQEYYPQAAYDRLASSEQAHLDKGRGTGGIRSDAYLSFLTQELKPFIDASYPTYADAPNTFIMGSSMGGLISLYAMSRYPQIFGGSGNVSTHWPVVVDTPSEGDTADIRWYHENRYASAYFGWLEEHLPNPDTHRIYFDYGTTTLDRFYEPFQMEMDTLLRRKGYEQGALWITRRFDGAAHSEPSWAQRVHVPLQFLLQ